MLGIGQGFQVFLVAAYSADIFGWAGPFAFQAQRISGSFFGSEATLKNDLVFPTIAKVVFVIETVCRFGERSS